jgi:hypothetical protein
MGSKRIGEMFSFSPETNTQRQVTQHAASPVCWAMGTKKLDKNILYWAY